MSRLATILATVLVALVGLAAGLPVNPNLAARTSSSLVHRSVGLGRDTVREDDRLERRDCKLSPPPQKKSLPSRDQRHSHGVNAPEKYEEKEAHGTRRTVTWTNSKSPQNLCGDSTFATSEDDEGPSVAHCRTFLDWVTDRDGFWLVTAFGSAGSWEEFARVESCVLAVRHTDSSSGTIP